MVLQNDTSIQIDCIIEGVKRITLSPKSSVSVDLDKAQYNLSIFHLYPSCRRQFFEIDNVYYMVIDSCICINDCKQDSQIVVSGEIVHFNWGYVYDKFLFFCQNCRIVSENCWITNLDELRRSAFEGKKKDSHFDRITTFLLSGGFWSMTGLFVLFKLIFWANDWVFPFWLIIFFWLFGYVIQWLGEKAFYMYMFQKQPKLSELETYASTEYILSYFYTPNRKWIADDRILL